MLISLSFSNTDKKNWLSYVKLMYTILCSKVNDLNKLLWTTDQILSFLSWLESKYLLSELKLKHFTYVF